MARKRRNTQLTPTKMTPNTFNDTPDFGPDPIANVPGELIEETSEEIGIPEVEPIEPEAVIVTPPPVKDHSFPHKSILLGTLSKSSVAAISADLWTTAMVAVAQGVAVMLTPRAPFITITNEKFEAGKFPQGAKSAISVLNNHVNGTL